MSKVRGLTAADEPALKAFLAAIPAGDRSFIKEDVTDPGLAGAWFADGDTPRAVATEGGRIVGVVGVVRGIGWSSHVGDVRLVVHPDYRRRGVGTQLARWGLVEAVRLGLKKLVVEVVAEQEAAAAMFQGLGFEAEALLKDQICDREGNFRDVLVLAHKVEGNWSGLATFGIR